MLRTCGGTGTGDAGTGASRAPHANWRGRSLTDIRTIIELIGATTTQTGLKVSASYDPNWYPKGVKITETQPDALPLHR